jgi:hypothetical protein
VELKQQNAQLEASHARTVTAKDAAIAKFEREHAALRADSAAQLAAIHAVVTSKFALELHPVRRDRRQFATLRVGPMPVDEFDTAWCAAACGDEWEVDIDPVTRMRAHVTQHARRPGSLTLRGAAPLPRCLPAIGASPPKFPSYRLVIEAYPKPIDGKDTQWCNVGFVPSHGSIDGASVTPGARLNIHSYGGWWFQVCPAEPLRLGGAARDGWTALAPRAAADGDAAAAEDTSTYATTKLVPEVLEGGAVELAVDYTAGTCRVAFYTPAAVAGGFVEAPYAKMELRFVATEAVAMPRRAAVPARSVPTAAADSRVQLYPAVAASWAGAIWRFV